MDELRGHQATWQLTTEADAIRIHYRQGLRQDAMLKRLAQCTVPIAALSSVDFHPLGKRRRWSLRLCLRERADPYAAVGAALTPRSDPFRLTGSAKSALLSEYWADQLSLAAQRAAAVTGGWLAARIATDLVPPVPLHIRTSEGTASFDGSTVRLGWSGSSASSRKRGAQRREFALSDITGVEWVPSDGWEWGFLRVLTRDAGERYAKPKHDLSCLRCNEGAEGTSALLLAATITAHRWASGGQPRLPPAGPDRTDPAEEIYGRIRELGRLHQEGILTDEEFAAKKAELLDRL